MLPHFEPDPDPWWLMQRVEHGWTMLNGQVTRALRYHLHYAGVWVSSWVSSWFWRIFLAPGMISWNVWNCISLQTICHTVCCRSLKLAVTEGGAHLHQVWGLTRNSGANPTASYRGSGQGARATSCHIGTPGKGETWGNMGKQSEAGRWTVKPILFGRSLFGNLQQAFAKCWDAALGISFDISASLLER